MKKIVFFFVLLFSGIRLFANEPDTVYLFSYATAKNNHHNGLHFAWSTDRRQWFNIGNEYGFLKSDYGRWGSEKRMLSPFLFQDKEGLWHCVWALNEREPLFAHAASKDLVTWGRQSYPMVSKGPTVQRPVVQPNSDGTYRVTYAGATNQTYELTTTNFVHYTEAKEAANLHYADFHTTIDLQGTAITGQVHRVPKAVVDKLIGAYEARQYRNSLYAETTKDDSQRFAGLKPVQLKLKAEPDKAKKISDLLTGVFFEDINYAADGGLYAELVQNRDFEYRLSDKEGRDKAWKNDYAWTLQGENSRFSIDSTAPVHANNPHYAVLQTTRPGAALVNSGFDGIAVKKGERYDLSLFSKRLQGQGGKLLVQLVSETSGVLAATTLTVSSGSWKKSTAVLTAMAEASDAVIRLQPLSQGRIALDIVSLFPQKTFKRRKNGLRADLAQLIADIHPRFVRFPGGCVAHGDGLRNIYRWKNTIGPLEARQPQRNLWGYHQTAGLGYFEYFQFCEDIGAQPLPVVAAGVPCQNSGTSATGGGQQCGIPLDKMDEYVQDILDLIEWANGDATTEWGKRRAAAGHPAPFNLRYLGIGNEDLISDVFEERFTLIFNAVKAKHPEITVIGTVGPFNEGTDYEQGWALARKLQVPVVDEHYYVSPGWMIHNQDFYDRYDRTQAKVYLGEYAAHLPGRPNNLETALAEALYLTALERNGDVVQMASYAPLLAKDGHTQWNPDLIYFNNTGVKPTVGYQVQKLYGQNAGNVYLPASLTLSNPQEAVQKRIATSIVRDTRSGDVIIKLVNLLPVTVQAELDLNGIWWAGNEASKTVLQGSSPADLKAVPVTTSIPVTAVPKQDLPPYSFTVIRFNAKNEL